VELKELEHFIAVVEYRGFSKAASNIYVSQPTLSKSVKKLEQTLDVILFERSTRSLQLTDAGELVYEKALKIMHAKEELQTALDDLLHEPSGEINIGIPPVIGTLFFPIIAKKFHQRYPRISLQLIEHGAKRIEYLIEAGEVDVGIVVLPVQEEAFSIYPITTEPFKLYVPPNHQLAKQSKVHLRELKNEPFILFNKEFSLHDLIINQCKTVGKFTPKIAYKSAQWDVITELVSAGLGVTLLPQSIYSKMNPSSITTVPLVNPPMWNLGVITKKDRYESFAVKELLTFLRSELSYIK